MDIFNLLKSGELDGIQLGVNVNNICAAKLGASLTRYNVSGTDDELIILKNDDLECHIFQDELIGMVIDLNSYSSNHFLSIKDIKYRVDKDTTIETFIRYLHMVEVKWKTFTQYCDGNRFTILTEGDASVEFIADDGIVTINRINIGD